MKKAILYGIASALITAAAIKAAPALAEQPAPAETNVSLVRTADLDLGSEAGRRQLDRRLAHAAREVCGTASDADVEGKNEVRKCRDESIARAQGDREALLAAGSRRALIAVTASR
mgnify:CR=1 FL=1